MSLYFKFNYLMQYTEHNKRKHSTIRVHYHACTLIFAYVFVPNQVFLKTPLRRFMPMVSGRKSAFLHEICEPLTFDVNNFVFS